MTDELAAVFDSAWALLEQGAANRKSPAHTPIFATIGADGTPTQRVLVLREADRATMRLRFHTDTRSEKVSEIGAGAAAHLLTYDPGAAIQLRISGLALVETDSAATDSAWSASTTFARRCYLSEAAPGAPSPEPTSGLPHWIEGEKPREEQVAPARPNFAIILMEATALDWLHLANSGHRRAQFTRDGDIWRGQWVVP